MAKYGAVKYGEAKYGESSAEYAEGGATSSVIITATGAGQSIRSGGSTASVVVSSEGSGVKIASGSSESSVVVSTEAGGTKTGQGAADAIVIISAEGGSSFTIHEGGSESVVQIRAIGQGSKITSGSSDAQIIISSIGSGRHLFIDINVAIGSNKKVAFDKNGLGHQGEQILLLVSVDASLIIAGYSAYIEAVLPNGIMEITGPYNYSSGKFYALLGETDDMLLYSGFINLQFVFCKLLLDGITKKNKHKTLIAKAYIKETV